jgi:hypothetical protein
MQSHLKIPALLVVVQSRLSLPGAQNAELRLNPIPAHTVDKPSALENKPADFVERLQTIGEKMRLYNHAQNRKEMACPAQEDA